MLYCCFAYAVKDNVMTDDINRLMYDLNNQSQDRDLDEDNSIWPRVVKGFSLNHTETADVKYWQDRYSKPSFFYSVINNAAAYIYFVLIETERRGFPSELIFIPIIESAYNPKAQVAHGVSTGIWQFEQAAMVSYGMRNTKSLDERMDIIKSTKSAMSYFQYLYNMFGNWETAIAAYNWGEGNVYNATVKAGGSKNFYDLSLRETTKQYVAKLIAIASIIENPKRFGLQLPKIPNQPYLMIIQPNDVYTEKEFINKLKISAKSFESFNPQFKDKNIVLDNNSSVLVPYYIAEKYYIEANGKVNKKTHNIDAILQQIDIVNEDIKQNNKSKNNNL